MEQITINSIKLVSGFGTTNAVEGGQPEAEAVLFVKATGASSAREVLAAVEQACIKPVKSKGRDWNPTLLSLVAADQDRIKRGDIVRAYDFPGMRDDCYVEGVVIERERNRVCIHILRDVAEGVEELVGPRLTVWSPLGVSSMSGAPCVFLQRSREKEII